MAKRFKDWNIDDIIAWCQENNQTEWLKEISARKVACKIYPRKKVQKEINGVLQYNDEGKPIMTSVADKSKAPATKMRPITFVQIKTEFGEKFGLAPAKQAKPESMFDKINKL